MAKKYEIIDENGNKIIFNSQKEFADKICISISGLENRLKNMSEQEAYNLGKSKKSKWAAEIILKDGTKKTFNSQQDLADEIGISLNSLKMRLSRKKSPQQAYDMNIIKNQWPVTILLKDGTNKKFEKRKDLSNEIGLKEDTLKARLLKMSPQEAYDYEFKYIAFCKNSFSLAFFEKIFNLKRLDIYYNKFKDFMNLEEIIIYKKLNQSNPEVCIDNKKGIFQPIDEFCKERNLDIIETLEKLKNGANPNNL